jgi:cell division inhibitor SulA
MTNEEFKICQVYNHHDIENVIKNLSENNYHTVIGGLTVAEMAQKYNLNAIMGIPIIFPLSRPSMKLTVY